MPAPKKPARSARAKASRPDVAPLDEHLAALLNPALNEQRRHGLRARRRRPASTRRAGRRWTPAPAGAAPDAADRAASGAQATADVLKQLLETGDPRLKAAPPVGAAPPAAPGKVRRRHHASSSSSEYEPKGDQPTAIARTRRGRRRPASATRCCSASPARARPSPWRR